MFIFGGRIEMGVPDRDRLDELPQGSLCRLVAENGQDRNRRRWCDCGSTSR